MKVDIIYEAQTRKPPSQIYEFGHIYKVVGRTFPFVGIGIYTYKKSLIFLHPSPHPNSMQFGECKDYEILEDITDISTLTITIKGEK
jgi:hypothetical protein